MHGPGEGAGRGAGEIGIKAKDSTACRKTKPGTGSPNRTVPQPCLRACSSHSHAESTSPKPSHAAPALWPASGAASLPRCLSEAWTQLQCGVEVGDPEEWIKGTLKWGLVEVVYQWAKGMSFEEICRLTSEYFHLFGPARSTGQLEG